MPVRVKPPPPDTGETISPTCAASSETMPSNGAHDLHVAQQLPLDGEAALGDGDVAAGRLAGGLQAARLVVGRLVGLVADEVLGDEQLEPLLAVGGRGEVDVALRGGVARRVHLRLGQMDLLFDVARIESRQQLARHARGRPP